MKAKVKAAAKPGTPSAKSKTHVKTVPSKPASVVSTTVVSSPSPPTGRPGSKTQVCVDLLARRSGATLDELMSASGWQAHSVRGFLSGTVKKKLGLALTSTRDDGGVRHYRVPQVADR